MRRASFCCTIISLGFALAGCEQSSSDPMKVAGDQLPDLQSVWDYRDPVRTERTFRQLLPVAVESGNEAYQAELLTQIARAQGMQGRFIEAHRSLDEAEPLITRKMPEVKLRYLLERGRVFNSAQQPDMARPLFEEAWDLARSSDHELAAIDAAHMMGIVEKGEASILWNERAMEVAEASTDPRARNWLGPLYNNTAWTYCDMGRFDRGLQLFEKDLAHRQRMGDVRGARIARWSIGKTLRMLGQADQALAIQQQLLREHEQANDPNGYVYEEIGECMLVLNRPIEARPYFARAYEALSKDPWLQANEPARLARIKQLSEAAR